MMALRPLCVRRSIAYWWIAGVLIIYSAASAQRSNQPPSNQIDREFVRETVKEIGALIDREYVDADMAARVDASLRQRLAEGRYSKIQSPQELATTLTRDLFQVSHDKHLAVTAVPDAPADTAPTPPAADESRESVSRRANFGVQRAEILPGNIGYVNITAFYRPDEAREAISAAMQMLRNADALILDLRNNAGGSPGTVALVASYLFDTPGLALFEIVPRSGAGRCYATATGKLPERNERRPVYVVTSQRTFSAGEGLAFILQERGRAEVIGEKTAGAANPGRPYRVNPRFDITVPNGKVQSALSGRNWEGVGVVPAIAVPACEALHVAQIYSLRRLLQIVPKGSWHDSLERQLRILEPDSASVPPSP